MSEDTGPIQPMPRPPDAATIQEWLVRAAAERLRIPDGEVEVDAPFAESGLSSQELVTLSGDLEQWLHCNLSPTLAWEYPTIAALARYLAEDMAACGPGTEA